MDVLIKYKFDIYLILIKFEVAQLIEQNGHQIQSGINCAGPHFAGYRGCQMWEFAMKIKKNRAIHNLICREALIRAKTSEYRVHKYCEC